MNAITGEMRMLLNHSLHSWAARLLIVISLLATLPQMVIAAPLGHCSTMADQAMLMTLDPAMTDTSLSIAPSAPSEPHCDDDGLSNSQCDDQQCQCSQLCIVQTLVSMMDHPSQTFPASANNGAFSQILPLQLRPPRTLI